MSTTAVLRREVRCARKVMLRDPAAVLFTVGLPLLYLFIFGTVFKGPQPTAACPARLRPLSTWWPPSS